METETAHQSPTVVQFSIFLHNRVGALLGVVKLLQDAQVLVLGLSLQDSVDVTVARIIVSDPERVETVFIERGIPYVTNEVLVVQLKEGAEGLSKCLAAFLQAETNIHIAYPLMAQPGGFSAMAMHVEDYDLGASVMEAKGYRVLRQSDISR
jgi:hypothetical protein